MKKWLPRIYFFCGFIACLYLVGILLGKTKPFEVQRQLDETHPLRIQYEADIKSFNDESTSWIASYRETPLSIHELYTISKSLQDFLVVQKGVEAVISPASAKYFVHDGDSVSIRNFIANEQLTSEAEGLLQSELWKNNLIREDHKGFLIRFRLSRSLKADDEKPLFDKIETFMTQVKNTHPGLEMHQIGVKVASAHFLEEMYFQQKVMTPILLLCLIIFFYWIFRSWQIVGWCFFVMFVCYVSTIVTVVLVEDGLGPYSSFALMFSFIVATTDLIQFFSRFQQLEGTVEERLKLTLKIAYWPCLLTSMTTAAGFFALILNVNESIRHLGLYCAFACMLEWVVIFYVLPPVLKIFNFNPRHQKFNMDRLSDKYFSILAKYKYPIVGVSLLSIVVGAIFTFQINIDDNFYTKFNAKHPLSQSINFFSDKFNFVGSVDVVINMKEKDLFSADKLNLLRKLEDDIKADQFVSRVRSLRQVDDLLVKQLESSKISQEEKDKKRTSALELFKAYGEFNELYNSNSQQLRTVVFLKSFATADFESVLAHIYRLQEKYKGQLEIRPGGFSVIRSYINGQVIRDFFESFILGFLLIFVCFWLLYRNVKWALLALIPNAIPLLLVAGLIGIFKIPVGTDLVVILCISFGISGDNTIQLAYVLQSLGAKQENYQFYLKKAMDLIGMAMLGSSGIFLCSLPVFFLGHLNIFHYIALFLSISFVLAFLSDLFTFPSIQLIFKDTVKFKFKKSENL